MIYFLWLHQPDYKVLRYIPTGIKIIWLVRFKPIFLETFHFRFNTIISFPYHSSHHLLFLRYFNSTKYHFFIIYLFYFTLLTFLRDTDPKTFSFNLNIQYVGNVGYQNIPIGRFSKNKSAKTTIWINIYLPNFNSNK